MSEQDSNTQEKKRFIYGYTEEQINAVLAFLGEQKAKEVNHLVNALKSPVKVDEVLPEVK